MLAYSENYMNALAEDGQDIREVVRIAFDAAGTDVIYITSHADIDLPVGAVRFDDCLVSSSAVSQRIDPVKGTAGIGHFKFVAQNYADELAAKFAEKDAAGIGMRNLQVSYWWMPTPLAWDDIKDTPTTSQLLHKYGTDELDFGIDCRDVQRIEKGQKIFRLNRTKLRASVSASATKIPVDVADIFELMYHGPSFSDAPGKSVFYVEIEKERIRCTGWEVDATLGLVLLVDTNGRGVLNTRAAEHNIDATTTSDARPDVAEVVYLEMPVIELIYGLMTGVYYSQAGKTFPSGWHCGVPVSLVATADFLRFPDLYDPANPGANPQTRAFVLGRENEDAKKYIEQTLSVTQGLYRPVYGTGEMGLKRIANIGKDAAHVAVLDDTNIISCSQLQYLTDDIVNRFEINWNPSALTGKTTRKTVFKDTASILKHGESTRVLNIPEFRGSIHAFDTLKFLADSVRQRSAGEPLSLTVTCLPMMSYLNNGDVVRVQQDVIDHKGASLRLDRAFEIQEKSIVPDTGQPTFLLAGASEPAAPIPDHEDITVLNDSEYEIGTDITTFANVSVVAGVAYLVGDITLTGASTIADTAGHYYCTYPLAESGGPHTITFTENAVIKVRGGISLPTTRFDGVGRSTRPAGGPIGASRSGGGFVYEEKLGDKDYHSYPGNIVEGGDGALPFVNITNDNGTLVLPALDLRGGQGAAGANSKRETIFNKTTTVATGGAPVNGGASITFIHRGMDSLVSGYIDTSGADGAYGTVWDNKVAAGTSGGGLPGCVLEIVDGAASNMAEWNENVLIAKTGDCPVPPGARSFPVLNADSRVGIGYSYYTHHNQHAPGEAPVNHGIAALCQQYVMPATQAEEDVSESIISPPTGVTASSGTADLLIKQDGTIESRVRVTYINPTHPYFVGNRIEFRRKGDTDWISVSSFTAIDSTEYFLTGLKEGEIYEIRMRSNLRSGEYSVWTSTIEHTVIGKLAPPEDVASITHVFSPANSYFEWPAVSDPDRKGYYIRFGTDWATATDEIYTESTKIPVPPLAAGPHTALIKAVDNSGNLSTNAASVAFTVNVPTIANVAYRFDGGDVVISWDASTSSYGIDYCTIYDTAKAAENNLASPDTNEYRRKVDWGGNKTFVITGTDIANNESSGQPILVTVVAPSQPQVTPQVIDNNVLFRWNDCTQSLPVELYEIRKGSVFATAEVIGSVSGTFDVINEVASGEYVFWFAGKDVAKNYGTEQQLTVNVDEPPDYVLKQLWESNLTGTLTNAISDDGLVIIPANTTETYANHFDTRAWATFNDKAAAGYDYWAQPVPNSGVYEEIFDYGAVLPGVLINVTATYEAIGNGTITPTISVRETAVDPWLDITPGQWSVYGLNFRYVKVRLDVDTDTGGTPANYAFYKLSALTVRLDVKNKTDQLTGTANAADPSGTWIAFNKQFIDVDSIALGIQSTDEVKYAYDFTDAPYPTGLYVYVWDSTGARATRDFSAVVRGV
ncbi:MAG: fibronectin type III domain-containing protein [Gammaproteobacteria bacterium]|nr:fibronectin type III domain-containing protein [Gammaproteobacteria bacterium]